MHNLYISRDTQYAICMTLLFIAVALTGCDSYYRASTPASDYYYLNPEKSLSTVGRAAIVELNNNSSYPQVAGDVTDSLFQALQKKQVFGLTVIRQADPQWQSLQLTPDATYSFEQLEAIRKSLKCDAALVGTITRYQPYPHMAIGLRLKIIDLTQGQLLWGLEQIWDSADKTTEQRMKSYFQSQIRAGFAPINEQLLAVSPIEFFKFVAFEVAETMKVKK